MPMAAATKIAAALVMPRTIPDPPRKTRPPPMKPIPVTMPAMAWGDDGRSGGPARTEQRHGQATGLGDLLHQPHGRPKLLGPGVHLGRVRLGDLLQITQHRPQMEDGLLDVARAGLTLGADHGRPLADAAQGLAQVGAATHEGHGEAPLVDVVLEVDRREHFALVDVVDTEGLEHLRLGEVTYASL